MPRDHHPPIHNSCKYLGEEAARAERAIKRKYPIVQGVLISLVKALKRDHGVYVEVSPQPTTRLAMPVETR
jgi:hypothetical protein